MAPSDKPGPVIDVDSLEKAPKRDERPAPLTIKVGDRMIPLADINDLDWQEVAELDPTKPVDFIYTVIRDDEDLNHFFAHKLSTRALNELLDRYIKHYRIPESGKPQPSRRR